ncbi:MAG: glycosyltransferase [Thomasclavelia spiroformis]
MKKILVIVPDMNLGGISTSVINFCNELDKRGNQVQFLNMGKKNNYLESKISKCIKRKYLIGKASKWQLGINDLKNVNFFKKLQLIPWALLKKLTNHSQKWLHIIFHGYSIEEEYDAVVAFRQCAPCYYFVLQCTNAKNKIAFIHGDINYMGDISSWDIYLDKFDKIACVSNAVKDGFQKRYQDIYTKFITVYNMFNIPKILEMSKNNYEGFVIDKSYCNIVTVSRIENETKRINIIPRICKILKDNDCSKFHWYIVGDGPDLEEDMILSEKLCTNDVLTFCGSMDNPYSMIKQSSFTVLPSKTEAYSMVVLESLILGIPIVVSRYNGVEEAIEEGVSGLIATQNIEDLAQKIQQLIENTDMLNTLHSNISKLEINNDLAYSQFMNCIY